MKKMLVLALVLAAASLANAGLILNVAGNTASIDGVAPSTYQGFFAVVGINGEVVVTDGLKGAAAPDLSNINGSINDGSGVDTLFPGQNGIWGVIASSSVAAGAQLATGNYVSGINLAYTPGPKASLVSVYALNEDGSLGDLLASATVNVVPEPMTMALLGLGGLFFARKK